MSFNIIYIVSTRHSYERESVCIGLGPQFLHSDEAALSGFFFASTRLNPQRSLSQLAQPWRLVVHAVADPLIALWHWRYMLHQLAAGERECRASISYRLAVIHLDHHRPAASGVAPAFISHAHASIRHLSCCRHHRDDGQDHGGYTLQTPAESSAGAAGACAQTAVVFQARIGAPPAWLLRLASHVHCLRAPRCGLLSFLACWHGIDRRGFLPAGHRTRHLRVSASTWGAAPYPDRSPTACRLGVSLQTPAESSADASEFHCIPPWWFSWQTPPDCSSCTPMESSARLLGLGSAGTAPPTCRPHRAAAPGPA